MDKQERILRTIELQNQLIETATEVFQGFQGVIIMITITGVLCLVIVLATLFRFAKLSADGFTGLHIRADYMERKLEEIALDQENILKKVSQ